MNLPVVLLSRADDDLQAAFDRFEDQSEGLGVEFLTVVDAYLSHISAFPNIAPAYLQTIRRQVIQRFPFGIFYEPNPTRILVYAILDIRQGEEQILRRLKI